MCYAVIREKGGKVLLGVGIYILAWLVLINGVFRAFLAHHADNPAAAGLSNLI